MYQVTTYAYVPWSIATAPAQPPVEVKVTYVNANLFVGDEMTAKLNITLNKNAKVQWAIVDLGVPPGFDVLSEDLDARVSQSSQLATKVRRYELTGSQIILYMENSVERGE